MHIYRLNEYEYWRATSLEEAIATAMTSCGLSREEVIDDQCHELTDTELDTLRFIETDEPGSEEPPEGWPERSFREQLALEDAAGAEAGIFAGTEW